jgi:hypothetical protein
VSTKRFAPAGRRAGRVLCAAAALALLLPAVVPGEVVRLKDGSTLKGRLIKVEGDTLTIRLSVGAPIKVHRDQVESIVFSDSMSTSPVRTVPAAPAVVAAGVGTIAVKFEDRKVSSKITIEKKKNWEEKMRSNDIVVEFVVDGAVVYSKADTTMDKTIYMGQEKQIKNDAELADFEVKVPGGKHLCKLVVRNRDPDTFHDSFDPAPLNLVLDFDTFSVDSGDIVRLDIRMDKGLLRMSSPKLYQSNPGKR